MARPLLLMLLAMCGATASLPAQSAPASLPIAIGSSATPLLGPWRFQTGDSPLDPVTQQPLWASPTFDDSAWESLQLTPKSSPATDATDGLPGWTTQGHPGYWGYAWYRIHLHIEPPPGARLAVAGPADVDDAYQIFWNAERLGSFGDFSHARPVTYYTQPMLFPLPGHSAGGDDVLAFRVWMEPNTLVTGADPGGFHSAPVIGEAAAVAAGYRLRWYALLRKYAPFALCAVIFSLLALVAFSLVFFDRADHVYAWMGAVFLLTAAYTGLGAAALWTQHVSILQDSLITQCFLGPLAYAGWAIVWWVWFGRQRPAWLPRAEAGLALLYMVSNAIAVELFYSLIPHPVATAFWVVSALVRVLFFAGMLWIVIAGIRRQGAEGWLVLPAVLFLGVGLFEVELTVLHVQLNWMPFGMKFKLAQLANLLLAATLALLLLRRLMLSVRRQRLIQMDARRAQLQSDFVSAVSHEFRSPLTTVRTIAELLAHDRIPDPDRRRQSYLYLDRETVRLQRLVEDLLDFGRMESGRKQYALELHDAFTIARSAVADLAEYAIAEGFHIDTSALPAVSACVRVDEEALRRAVRNLLENAMKYSAASRQVIVRGELTARHVLLSVQDRGLGIDPNEQQLIFQKFVRGSAAKTAGINGTGIGLAMVQEVATAMNAEVRLDSELGVGSTFTLVLPLAVAPVIAPAAAAVTVS